jgi:hypothetical protein
MAVKSSVVLWFFMGTPVEKIDTADDFNNAGI